MTIRKEDIRDLDIIDSEELASDGYYVYLSSTLVSTTSSTSVVEINMPPDNEGILYGRDNAVESGDRIYLTGTSGGSADGYYIVDEILTNLTLSIDGYINDSTDGYIYFMHPVGSSKIGFDPTGLSKISSHNVQDAIVEISINSISENQHTALRQLIHFINEGPASGFASGAYKEVLPEADPFPTSVIWYTSIAKTNKIVEKTYTYNSNKTPATVTWKIYDASDVLLATVTDTIAYNGVFEVNRTRTIA